MSLEPIAVALEGPGPEEAADVRRLDASRRPLSPEEIQAKISRGLNQLDRGEFTSGEEFMADLMSGIDEGTRGSE